MKYVLLLLAIASFQLDVCAIALRDFDQAPRTLSHLYQVVLKYDKDSLVNLIRNFIKETRPTRVVGSEGHYKSGQFIFDHIKKTTVTEKAYVVIDEFSPDIDHAISMYKEDLALVKTEGANINKAELKKWTEFTNSRVAHLEKLRSIKGKNVIWEKKGLSAPNEVLVIGAHYDTMAYDKKTLEIKPLLPQPGADNNASGVAAALALIELLSELKLQKTVRVVFFDYQELGFLGSLDYAKKLSEEVKSGNIKLHGFLNLLMLGHDSKLSDKAQAYGNMVAYYSSANDSTTTNDEKVLLDKLIASGKVTSTGVSFNPISKTFKNGDSVSFNKFQIPAITFTQNWEDDFNGARIHTSSDFVETLNLKTYYDSFRFVAGAVSAWALGL